MFFTQSYFSVPKDVRLNCTHYVIFKLNNKRELQNIAINHSADIDYKDFVVQKIKLRYYPLGQVFNKGLKTDEKQVSLLKILKYIEDKTDKQLNENKHSQLGIKSIGYTDKEELSQEEKNMLEKLNNQKKLINYKKIGFAGGNKIDYNFSDYRSLKELFKTIYCRNITIEEAEGIQGEANATIDALGEYKPKKF